MVTALVDNKARMPTGEPANGCADRAKCHTRMFSMEMTFGALRFRHALLEYRIWVYYAKISFGCFLSVNFFVSLKKVVMYTNFQSSQPKRREFMLGIHFLRSAKFIDEQIFGIGQGLCV